MGSERAVGGSGGGRMARAGGEVEGTAGCATDGGVGEMAGESRLEGGE
jgi:hypothetical protein